jgi:uncharacterized cupin superfamily protein
MRTPTVPIHAAFAPAELLGLELVESGMRDGATSGTPVESLRTLYADDLVQVGVWECTPGIFPAAKHGVSEQLVILDGDGTLYGDDGTAVELVPGATAVTPDGWSGRWEIRLTVRKLYVVWKRAPPEPPMK